MAAEKRGVSMAEGLVLLGAGAAGSMELYGSLYDINWQSGS